MAGDPWWRTALLYAGAVRPRLLERPLWRRRYANGFPPLDAARFRARLGWDGPVATALAARLEARFGIGPQQYAAMRQALAGSTLDRAGLARAMTLTTARTFDLLGSGPRTLGVPVDWHVDFQRGVRFEAGPAWTINYSRHATPRDVKLPWELARGHWMLWLGEARLLGDATAAATFTSLLTEWLDANPVGWGIHWACPMELAMRAHSWVLALACFADAPECDDALLLRVLETLWWHGEVISGNLEYGRRLNNHYIADGFGLLVLGLLFRELPTGRRWLARGQAILERQIRWQVHGDGASYEKSVSYHRLVLEFFAAACALGARNGRPFSAGYRARLERMHDFTAAYQRPDGSTPLVSDADDGRLLRPVPEAEVTDHRHALGVGALLLGRGDWKAIAGQYPAEAVFLLGPESATAWDALPGAPRPLASVAFPEAGYYVMRGADTHTFLDAGPIGFEGDAVHGHNDTLSFELAAPGGVFIVDSGTYCYTSEPAEHRAHAATAAHNTVTVDGREVAEFAGLWKLVADTTDPEVLEWVPSPEVDRWRARHHGYARLPEPVVHERAVTHWKGARRWLVEDRLTGRGRHEAVFRLHLHPAATLERLTPTVVRVRLGAGALRIAGSEDWSVADGWVAPRYGVRHAGQVLMMTVSGNVPLTFRTELAWEPGDDTERGG